MPPEHHAYQHHTEQTWAEQSWGNQHSDSFDDTQPSRFSGQLDVPPPRSQRAPRTPPPAPPGPNPPRHTAPDPYGQNPPGPNPPGRGPHGPDPAGRNPHAPDSTALEITSPQLPPQLPPQEADPPDADPPETGSASVPTRRVPPPGSVPDDTTISRVPIDSDQASLDPPTYPGGVPGQAVSGGRRAARRTRRAEPDRQARAEGRREPPAVIHPEPAAPRRRKRARPVAQQPTISAQADDGQVLASAITSADGLGKFDLGTVPASVTPPRSWRRAAWFAVASSMGVVVALLFAAATLVGPPKNAKTIDALPNGYANNDFPYSMRQSPSGTGTGSNRQDATTQTERDEPTTGESRDDASSDAFGAAPQSGIGSSNSSSPSGSDSVTGSPSGSGPPSSTPSRQPQRPPSPKPVVKVHNRGIPVADADRMAENTSNYYYAVTEDPQAAHQLTTGSSSPEEIEQRYADVAYVLVREIEVYPDRPVTVNTVEVTYEGGDTVTEQRELAYSPGPDPKVESEN